MRTEPETRPSGVIVPFLVERGSPFQGGGNFQARPAMPWVNQKVASTPAQVFRPRVVRSRNFRRPMFCSARLFVVGTSLSTGIHSCHRSLRRAKRSLRRSTAERFPRRFYRTPFRFQSSNRRRPPSVPDSARWPWRPR